MTVKQLLANTDSYELSEWMVMSDLEKWKVKLAESKRGATPTSAQLFGMLFKGVKKK